MNRMAKTIMIANELYEELKRVKGSRSFSEVIKESLDGKPKKITSMRELCDRFAGIIPEDDREYDEALKASKKMWDQWQKRMEKELAEEESA